MESVREALRTALTGLGYRVASDTYASRGELYVIGDNDLARALFEFQSSPEEAFEKMYQGSWTEGLPPRFAVLPVEAAEDPYFETLEQARIIPLLFDVRDDAVRFCNLDVVKANIRP